MLHDVVLTYGGDPGRVNLARWAHKECPEFAEGRISDVHGDLAEEGLLEQPSPWGRGR